MVFGIVVAGHLLLQQGHQKFSQVEVTRQQSKFLQHQLGAAQTLGVFVLGGVLGDIGFHLVAADQLALDLVLDREQCVATGKLQNLIHRAKKFLSFLRRNLLLFRVWCGAGALARGLLGICRLPCLRPTRKREEEKNKDSIEKYCGKSLSACLQFIH